MEKIEDFPMKDGDFSLQHVSSPEGIQDVQEKNRLSNFEPVGILNPAYFGYHHFYVA